MTEPSLRKRDREPEALPDSSDVRDPKRFHGEETGRFLHLLQLDQSSAEDDRDEYFAPSEELVNRMMRSLEEEIATCSSSYPSSNSGDNYAAPDISSGHESQTLESDSNSGDNYAAPDISSGHESQTLESGSGADLLYLLEASDDQLGIPPSPVLELKEEVCQSSSETSEILRENPDLESLAENWHFEDDFQNCQQFALYDNAWDAIQLEDYMNIDFVSQGRLFDADFSGASRVETARVML